MTEKNTPKPIEVPVHLGERSYTIHIGVGLLSQIDELLETAFPPDAISHLVLIYDQGVAQQAQDVVECCSAQARITQIEVPSGEVSKSIARLQEIWELMLREKTDRGSIVVALGGGVVGDLAGFAASSFARGIPLVQIPTTLLSQVDSSVGGKTGINLPGAKNILGAFWQPRLVVIDQQTLATLPQREYLSGIAEVVKYGVILLPELFEYLENNVTGVIDKSPEVLGHIIAESCRAKAQVVKEDERETSGRRAILNYGHTFAHAMESVSEYGMLLHGEAVAIGMHMAAVLALQLGRVDQAFVDRQRNLLHALNLPTQFQDFPAAELWARMQHDKKVEHGQLRFILPGGFGQVDRVAGISEQAVCQAIDAANAMQS